MVASFDGEWAHMEMQGKRLRVRRSELEPVSARAGGAKRPEPGGRRKGPDPGGRQASDAKETIGPTAEVNVIGQRLEEAIDAVEHALDQALLSGAGRLRVIHGHGTGRVRQGVREHFRKHGAVASWKAADPREGGNGATILELR